jgi:hypothetical protein
MSPSDLVRKIAGTFIEDERKPNPPVKEWITEECRNGCFKAALEAWSKTQPEPLRPDLVIVEKLFSDRIMLKIPCRAADHESSRTFYTEVSASLNPATLSIKRA